MPLTKLSLSVDAADLAGRLSGLLAELEPPPLAVSHFRVVGAAGWVIEAYYAQTPEVEDVANACSRLVSGWAGKITLEAVAADANWVAISQAALPPVAVGPFLVHGSHDRHAARRRRWAIEIDANEAFGTAHHASTQGCLIALARLVRSNTFNRVLDLGCGSGILAFAAARALPAASVVACDIDPRAIEVARTNARINRFGCRISFVVADGLSHALLRRNGFDLLLANIIAEPLMRLAPRLAHVVQPGGRAILSGLLDREADKVAAAYVAAGFVRTGCVKREGWTTLMLQRRPSLRRLATASSCWPHRPWRGWP
jgi:ribosomal protein L11 methyltransferase